MLRLDHGVDETFEFAHINALRHVLQCVASRAAHPYLAQHLADLVRQWPAKLLRDVSQGGIKAKTGLNRHCDQIECVGQALPDRHLAGPHAPPEPDERQ